MRKDSTKKAERAPTFPLTWVFFLFLFWWLLAEGGINGLWFASLVIFSAFLVRRAMPIPFSPFRIHLIEAVFFVPEFIWLSVLAGIDVAWRALAPGLPIQPRMSAYPLRIRSTGARVLLAQVISLMPGTLTCEVDQAELIVHVLSGEEEKIIADAARLEARIAAVFLENIDEAET